jgi:NAD(P)-dependent dehydrogenase (short-subunit alcohol dehydrogenase family)
MEFNFKNQTILITGATRGIGKQIANDLHLLGANLLLTGTHVDEIDSLNREAVQNNENKKYFCLDLMNLDSVNFFLNDLKSYNRIDCLVNNAGINRLNYIQEANQTDWNDMIAVNLTAPFQLLNLIAPKMIEKNYGRIINIASIFSKISKEKRSVYSATKFGIHGLTVGVSNDLARHNILVNTVSPGFVLTDLTRKNLSELEREQIAVQLPIKRLAETKDISNVVVFLLSDLNQYVTGQNIIVDGGFTNV